MKCKHENADHLKPGEWSRALVEQFRCLDCGAWLSLGHSDETPVAVEIRAAELAEPGALLRNGHEGNGRCDVGDDWYSDHDEYPDDWHAGYLARVIATHGEDQ